jgi:hypothetical protein
MQKSLMDTQEYVGVAAAAPEQLPAVVVPSDPPPRSSALATIREHAMSVPVETMMQGLGEYWDRRKAFREWLLSKLVEGVHYGVPPGCEPKGNVNPKQWQNKPSLYKAGADFIVDLLGARQEFKADNEAWVQLGSEKGKFVYGCYLFSNSTGALIGEGRGCRRVGQKGGDENNAIKMAMKNAKVDAVINSWGLSDLFSQEADEVQPPVDNPEPKADAPKVPPRGKRLVSTDIEGLGTAFKNIFRDRPEDERDIVAWMRFVENHAMRKFDCRKVSNWTEADYLRVKAALEGGAV